MSWVVLCVEGDEFARRGYGTGSRVVFSVVGVECWIWGCKSQEVTRAWGWRLHQSGEVGIGVGSREGIGQVELRGEIGCR